MAFIKNLIDAMLDADYSDGVTCPVCNSKAYWYEDEIKAVWICPSCGYEILGDQIELNDDGIIEKTLGIDWFCDNCNAYLNNQVGFDPYNDAWTCAECGYENDITKDNVW